MTRQFGKRTRRLGAGSDRGQVLVLFAVFMITGLALVAFVTDIGHGFMLKRHLQASADAAALAAAQDLPDEEVARLTGHEYSAGPSGKNERSNFPAVTTSVCFPEPRPSTVCHEDHPGTADRVRVTQRGTSSVFFGRILGFDGFDVSATAVASRTSTTTGTPLAIFIYERCGIHGVDRGFISGGDNMIVEGSIHSNGNWEVKNPGFVAEGRATWYRPPPQGSSDLHTGNPQGAGCKNIDLGDSTYCTECPSGDVDQPADGPWRDWATAGLYDSRADTIARVGPCTHSPSGDVSLENVVISTPSVYCLAPGKKFELKGNVTGPSGGLAPLTVLADIITIGGTSKLKPAKDTEPVLFYSTSSIEIVLNPSIDSDWAGYIINRFGGVKVNAANVTSPFRGLLEGQWVEINGENFRMLGTAPDTVGGMIFTDVVLEE